MEQLRENAKCKRDEYIDNIHGKQLLIESVRLWRMVDIRYEESSYYNN